jgi:hypothetical protein
VSVLTTTPEPKVTSTIRPALPEGRRYWNSPAVVVWELEPCSYPTIAKIRRARLTNERMEISVEEVSGSELNPSL